MRRSQVSFLLTIATTLLLLLGLLLGWVLAGWLAAGRPMDRAWLFGLGLLALLVAATIGWLHRFQHIYFLRIKALIDEAQIILQSNPERRLHPSGPGDVHTLVGLLNQYAERVQTLLTARDEQVQQARADLEEERNLLATLMADLSDGVVVCNCDGRILLYNVHARQLLSAVNHKGQEEGLTATAGYVGLGRSIFGLLDRNALTYALNRLQRRATDDATLAALPATANFITTTTGGALVRTQMAPLLATTGTLHGFVLTLHDMTERLTASSRRDFLLQRLTERMRGGLGNIRAAIELLAAFPDMSPHQLQRFQHVIEEEATGLSAELDQTMRDFAHDLRAQWRFEEMTGSDLLWAIEHYLTTQAGLRVHTMAAQLTDAEQLWLRVDSYAVVHGLATAVRTLHSDYGVAALDVQLHPLRPAHEVQDHPSAAGRVRRFATLDVRWSSLGMTTESWLAWKARVSTVDAGDATLTLREVAEQHGSEVWFQHDPAAEQSYFRLLLPLAETPPTALPTTAMAPTPIASRPEYYDFDLFSERTARADLSAHTLGELTYTVFDTETTGLDPARDEIVAIGAVRVLNGRLLRQEIYDQLVDPQRAIPHLATTIHGIDNRMVAGQPTIDAVLPRFARFAEDTVIVGHNLAFDLRMFAAKQAATGVHLEQPVLDTLLLSEVIHPDEQNHELEAIAERLGVNVLGRHTALGDAFVTAEVFLRMIPLLNTKGIYTLAEALTASKATFFARVRY
jgi:DNA polymerase-3 subunit epsilon